MKKKRERLLTNRNFPENDTAFEFIEREEYEGKHYLYHRCGETRIELNDDGSWKIHEAEGCFPISVDLVQERFKELGREYIPSGKEYALTFKNLMNT